MEVDFDKAARPQARIAQEIVDIHKNPEGADGQLSAEQTAKAVALGLTLAESVIEVRKSLEGFDLFRTPGPRGPRG